jgi:hypothetical protein
MQTQADLLFDRHIHALHAGECDNLIWKELWLECFESFVQAKRANPEPLADVGFAPCSARTLSFVHSDLQSLFDLFIAEPPAPKEIFVELYRRLLLLIKFCAGVDNEVKNPKFGRVWRQPSHGQSAEEEVRVGPDVAGARDSSEVPIASIPPQNSKGVSREREQFIAFYRQHDPTRALDIAAHVDSLLENYSLVDIMRSLLEKYGALPEGWSGLVRGSRPACLQTGAVQTRANLPQIGNLANVTTGRPTVVQGLCADDPLLAQFKPIRVGGGWALSFKERNQLKALQKARKVERKAARQQLKSKAAVAVQGAWRCVLAMKEANRRWSAEETRKKIASTTELLDPESGEALVLPAVVVFGGVHFINRVISMRLSGRLPSGGLSRSSTPSAGGSGGWHALQSLDLRGCTGLGDSSVEVIAAQLPQLGSLDLSGASGCTGTALIHVAEGMPLLSSLQICAWHRLTPDGLRKFSESLARNRTVKARYRLLRGKSRTRVNGVGGVNEDGGVGGVNEDGGVGGVNEGVQQPGRGGAGGAGGAAPHQLEQQLPNRRVNRPPSPRHTGGASGGRQQEGGQRPSAPPPFILSGQAAATSPPPLAAATSPPPLAAATSPPPLAAATSPPPLAPADPAPLTEIVVPTLRRLNLSACTALTDEALEVVGTHLQGCVDLCLYGCGKLTDRAAVLLLSCDSHMEHINTAGAYKITDGFRRYLLNQQPSICFYNDPNAFGMHGCNHNACYKLDTHVEA